ncbi:MAG TPA: hypothetical protein VK729_04385 [Silvibacterium sp.]|nr:hypothetical protein [Silvibacterium sp.]
MAKARIASILVDTLAYIGVTPIYGTPGDSLNGITDAIRAHESLPGYIHAMKKLLRLRQEPKRT